MSDTATKNGLEVVTIEGATSISFHVQAVGTRTLPDGRVQTYVSTVPTNDLDEFERIYREESANNSISMYLSVLIPDRKSEDGMGYFTLSELIGSKHLSVAAGYDEESRKEQIKKLDDLNNAYGPDAFRLHLDGTTINSTEKGWPTGGGVGTLVSIKNEDGSKSFHMTKLVNSIRCTFYTAHDAIFMDVDGLVFVVPNADKNTRQIIARRNEIVGIKTPARLAKWAKANRLPEKERAPIDTSDAFPFHTSQEMDILNRAQCDGNRFARYFANEQAGMIAYERKGATHSIRLALTEDERAGGLTMNYLETLVRAQDADAVIATAYILGVLAPPAPLAARAAAIGWIDFNDVIKKIGWNPQTTKERREMHARLWDFVKYGERAHIVGKRSGPKYKDENHNEINTTIHGKAWGVMKTEMPDNDPIGPPVAVQITVSPELTALITHPKTTQYLPMAEILGAIPGGQPSGAWARMIGAALFSFWRRNPREAINGTIQPTRRELLDHFTAKVTPYEEILEGSNPARAIEYWCDAMQILADSGFIEREGEATITAKQMRAELPRKNWAKSWLDEAVNIEPGAVNPAIEERAKALPAAKARDLKKKPRAKKLAKS